MAVARWANRLRRGSMVGQIGLIVALVLPVTRASAQNTYEPCAGSASTSVPTPSTQNIRTIESKMNKPAADGSVVISAHRGYWQNAPENSLTSIYEGIRIEADFNEVDLFETADNVPVLSHDNDIARTTTGSQQLISDMESSSYLGLQLRDRHGCPTNESPVSAEEVVRDLFAEDLIYIDSNNNLAGTPLVFDVKGINAAATYHNLLDAITVWNDVLNSDTSYLPLAPSILFKIPLSSMPQGAGGPAQFAQDIINRSPSNYHSPLMLYVIYSTSYTSPNDPTIQAFRDVPYQNDSGTLGFETHERYLNDGATAIRQALQNAGLTVGAFSPDNFFPEGDPSGNICCKLFNMMLSAPSQPSCLSGGVGSCLDERVRWDFLSYLNSGVLTLERPLDAMSYYSLLGRRGSSPPVALAPNTTPPAAPSY